MLLEIKTVCFVKLPLLNWDDIYVSHNMQINLDFSFDENIELLFRSKQNTNYENYIQ